MTTQKSSTSAANSPDQPAAGGGMPAKTQQPQQPMPDKHPDFKDASIEQSLALPHERDQASSQTSGMSSGQTSPRIAQAAKDVQKGRQDTSKAKETGETYQKL